MIDIDGSQGEGGGQILRTSLALSVITGTPLRLSRIRAGRPKPGLMRQHLTCVQAAAAISRAEVTGAELGSDTLMFVPQGLHAGDYEFRIDTAGSCTLVLQTMWPALMLADAPSRVRLHGGTHNPLAPPFHFLARSYAPLLAKLGARSELSLQRMGFAPAGGGEMRAEIHPAASLQPVDVLSRGERLSAWAEAFAPALPRSVAHRELQTVGEMLGWSYEAQQLRMGDCRQNEGPGNALVLTLEHEHVTQVFCELGTKALSAEQVAQRVVRQLRRHAMQPEAALDEFLADQWTLPLALAVHHSGQAARFTCTKVSAHTQTNCAVIERFLPVRFVTERLHGEQQPANWLVRCEPA